MSAYMKHTIQRMNVQAKLYIESIQNLLITNFGLGSLWFSAIDLFAN